ncbi:MAG: lipid-binding SYLF domain-containing protein [Deltaproteobacteria bacterium]|nr:lipid-binding SYLF domain-containing protein [Deltaproteobacteria bacterium]
MKGKDQFLRRGKFWLPVIILLTLISLILQPAPALANGKQEASQLVVKARFLVESFMGDPNLEGFRDLIKRAKAVFLVPDLLKGAFIVGASGGNGLLLVADPKTGTWDGPAFYTVGGASFGLQIGGSASDTAILIMTERGITSFLGNSLKLGADVGVAAGPIGLGASAATANLSVDLISFSRSRGLYGGVSLDGSVVAVRDDLNAAFYGRKVTPTDIFIRHEVKNPEASVLIEEVVKAAKK